MSNQSLALRHCPAHDQVDDRKSATIDQAARQVEPTPPVTSFAEARGILRNADARQAGFLADLVTRVAVTRAPILYQHSAEHRRQRGATARFFAPRVVTSAYRALMVRTSDRLVEGLQAAGRTNLDQIGLDMAVTIAAEIVGLTDSDPSAMARRLGALVTGMPQGGSWAKTVLAFAKGQVRAFNFLWREVKPAIRSRSLRRQRRDDVISHLLDEGYTDRDILTECLTYGAAGMVTTREFITMAGWHLLENDTLRARFLRDGETGRLAILEEILRLEPVVGMLRRKVDTAAVAIDVRGTNGDTAMFGACPYSLDPDRTVAPKASATGLAFGDGEHRCPGAQVALQEAAIFLDRLLRVPGLRLVRAPEMGWNGLISGYELRGAVIAFDETKSWSVASLAARRWSLCCRRDRYRRKPRRSAAGPRKARRSSRSRPVAQRCAGRYIAS